MTTLLGVLALEEAAKQAAGNWQNFECFVWHRRSELTDADNWAILYTHHRDSDLLDQPLHFESFLHRAPLVGRLTSRRGHRASPLH